jgi:hypothetical protein
MTSCPVDTLETCGSAIDKMRVQDIVHAQKHTLNQSRNVWYRWDRLEARIRRLTTKQQTYQLTSWKSHI